MFVRSSFFYILGLKMQRYIFFPFLRVQIAIGPYEVKEDSLAGLKAAFEAFVYVSDQKFEFTSNKLRTLLPESQVLSLRIFINYHFMTKVITVDIVDKILVDQHLLTNIKLLDRLRLMGLFAGNTKKPQKCKSS